MFRALTESSRTVQESRENLRISPFSLSAERFLSKYADTDS